MRLFGRKKEQSLSESQSVPDGTFRCDVCRFVQPLVYLCGVVADAKDTPPKTHILCSICAIWLGFGETSFPQGLRFNLSVEERDKIRTLHKELDVADKGLEETTSLSISLANTDREKGLDVVHEFLEQVPNLRQFIRLRYSLLPTSIVALSGRLTRREPVDPSEIKKANS